MGVAARNRRLSSGTRFPRGPFACAVRQVAFAAAVTLAPHPAFAGESARLVYSRTAPALGCPDEKALRRAVAGRLGYDPFVAASVNSVVAELLENNDGLKARVYVIRDGNVAGGARELTAKTRDCTELIAAVALALSIAIDPDALDRAPAEPEPTTETTDAGATNANSLELAEPAPAPAAEHTSRPRAAVTKETPARDEPAPVIAKPDQASRVAAGITPFAASWPVPALNLGAAGEFALSGRTWTLAAEPFFALPASTSNASQAASVSVWTFGTSLSGGVLWHNVYAGAVFDAQVLQAQGQHVDRPKSLAHVLADAGLRLAYHWHLSEEYSSAYGGTRLMSPTVGLPRPRLK